MNDAAIVTTAGDLAAAAAVPGADIEVRGEVSRDADDHPRAGGAAARLRPGAKGIRLTSDNVLDGVTIRTRR